MEDEIREVNYMDNTWLPTISHVSLFLRHPKFGGADDMCFIHLTNTHHVVNKYRVLFNINPLGGTSIY